MRGPPLGTGPREPLSHRAAARMHLSRQLERMRRAIRERCTPSTPPHRTRTARSPSSPSRLKNPPSAPPETPSRPAHRQVRARHRAEPVLRVGRREPGEAGVTPSRWKRYRSLAPRAVHDPHVLRASGLVRPGPSRAAGLRCQPPWLFTPKGRPAAALLPRCRA